MLTGQSSDGNSRVHGRARFDSVRVLIDFDDERLRASADELVRELAHGLAVFQLDPV